MDPKRHSESFAGRGSNFGSISVTGFVLPQSVCRCLAFGPAEPFRSQSIFGATETSTTRDTDAATLCENVLTIQNAADLEWPADDPANAGVRGEFLLGIFPPDHGGNHTPPPTPPAK